MATTERDFEVTSDNCSLSNRQIKYWDKSLTLSNLHQPPSDSPSLSLSTHTHTHAHTHTHIRTPTYRVSQEKWTKLRESVPYVKLYRYNPKHLYPKLNGYGDNGHRKVWASGVSTYCKPSVTPYSSLRMPGNEKPLANIAMQWPWRDNAQLRPAWSAW